MPKFAVIPSNLLGGPENPGQRWDVRLLLVLATLLDPKLSAEEAADILAKDCERKKVKLGDVYRAANSESATRLLADKYGVTLTDRIKPRFEAMFRVLINRHRGQLSGQIKDIESAITELDRRFQAETTAQRVVNQLLEGADLSVRDLIAQDRLCEMANLKPRLTGLPFNLFVSERDYAPARHRPCVKVFDRQRDIDASVSVDDPIEVMAGTPITGKDFQAVRDYILQNREFLLALWNGQIDQDEYTRQQRPLPT